MAKKYRVTSEINGKEKFWGHFYGSGENPEQMAIDKAIEKNGEAYKEFLSDDAVMKAVRV